MAQRPQLKDVTTLNQLSTFYPTEKDIAHLLMNEKLIRNEASCGKCGNKMSLRSRGDGYEWRCRLSKGKDCSSKSIKSDSFFAKSKLSLYQAVKILVLWNQRLSSKNIASESGVSEQSICDWKNFLREICVRIEERYPKIGGLDHIVEIDESNVHTRKYGRGQGIQEDWVLGGVDRSTGRVFAQRVPNRAAITLVPLLQKSIEKSSIVYSDECLIANRRVCTNGVEAMWSRMKKPFKSSNGTSSDLLSSYISEFVCRENEKDQFFATILQEIRKLAA
ncbi:hypothetical protein CRE_02584 [Caenorhabditis remanei]|uniref:ISXO2-like transposase domain-containing protein n=1 Tax=Caenorhabditis remanei TaxID=31234 RepID=E3N4V3_CAERE|nr:hypothetical protein CRE_02584 [Caenorhabditis remanei]